MYKLQLIRGYWFCFYKGKAFVSKDQNRAIEKALLFKFNQ